MKIEIKYPRAKPYFSPQMKEGILKNISGILDSGMLTQGKYVAEFEDKFKKEINTKYAVATSSCTSALEIAIKSLELKNTNILVTTNTWMSCANVILLTGNKPVFVDINPDTLNMCTTDLINKLDSAGAIIWVHMAGLIIPDFFTKADIYRNHGTTRNPQEILGLDYGVTCHYPSQNYRMTEIAGILGLYQLEYLQSFVKSRNHVADLYRKYLKNTPGINLLPKYEGHSYWNFFILLDKDTNRDNFAKILLHEFGIQTANAYAPAIHQQEIFKPYLNKTKLPVADDILARHISLPMYTTLKEQDIHYITNCIKDALNRSK